MNRERVRGTVLGVAIGDALGMPVESKSAEEIKSSYGRITEYHAAKGHKYVNKCNAGTWTDDTQLTLGILRAITKTRCVDMGAIAKAHVDAYNDWTSGWGATTRDSVRRLKEGSHWSESATGFGLGNGVAMKISPLAICAYQQFDKDYEQYKVTLDAIGTVCLMTHQTRLALQSGYAQAFALAYLFDACVDPKDFSEQLFIDSLMLAADKGKTQEVDLPTMLPEDHDLVNRFSRLGSVQDPIEEFGGGSAYCYNSLPFTYHFFLQNPFTIDSLYDCVSAGGDADTNGSMLASLLGALHGPSIFPEHLLAGLDQREQILALVDEFCDTFKIE